MSNWLEIEIGERRSSLSTISNDTGMDESSIEKDWWVTAVLKALFQSSCSAAINFKGGTSLSKGWNLITRFSEDIDVAIDKSFWNIKGETESQRDKLRKVSRKYIQETLCKELDTILREMGVSGYTLEFKESTTSDADPSTINIHYDSIVEDRKSYIPPSVKVEISCRSLWEPCEVIEYKSFIASYFPKENFIDAPFMANTVYPTRTFLEKAFLLHEEFQKTRIRTIRMSRHLYDLEKLMDTKFAQEALVDIAMYNTIIQHRKDYSPIRGIDYSLHSPATINFIPPASVIDAYRGDYHMMQEIFIYGESLAFEKLMERIEELNGRFRAISDK